MTFKAVARKMDESLGGHLSELVHRYREVSDYEKWRLQFQVDRLKRWWNFVGHHFPVQDHTSVVRNLKADGFATIIGAVDPAPLAKIRDEAEEHFNSASNLNPVSNDSLRVDGDRASPDVFLSEDDLAKGEEYLRHRTNNISLKEPLVHCPSVAHVALDNLLIDVAAGYLGCIPAIGGVNLRKSYANDLCDFDTNYFHSDPNSPKFLKFFFYLNNVDENGGPFCYVRGSHRRKFPGWRRKYRWTFEEMVDTYGRGSIRDLTAKVGDLIVADTTGFHRGTKVRTTDRMMLTVNYVVHIEFRGKQKPFQLSSCDYEYLSAKQRAATSFLEVIR